MGFAILLAFGVSSCDNDSLGPRAWLDQPLDYTTVPVQPVIIQAHASDSDGVHLGQDDFSIPLARELLGENRIIGGSAVTLEEARRCLDEGADYVGFGPVYPTTSKEDAGPVTGINLMKEVIDKVSLPLIAIGGINKDNTPEVIRARAHGIAVISAVCCHEDPEHATRKLFQALKSGM